MSNSESSESECEIYESVDEYKTQEKKKEKPAKENANSKMIG